MMPLLVTKELPQLVYTTVAHHTNTSKIVELELELQIQDLQEHVAQIEHPGTASLESILKYSYPKPAPAGKEPQVQAKSFTSGILVTTDSIMKTLQDIKDVKEKKAEDLRLKKSNKQSKRLKRQLRKNARDWRGNML